LPYYIGIKEFRILRRNAPRKPTKQLFDCCSILELLAVNLRMQKILAS